MSSGAWTEIANEYGQYVLRAKRYRLEQRRYVVDVGRLFPAVSGGPCVTHCMLFHEHTQLVSASADSPEARQLNCDNNLIAQLVKPAAITVEED